MAATYDCHQNERVRFRRDDIMTSRDDNDNLFGMARNARLAERVGKQPQVAPTLRFDRQGAVLRLPLLEPGVVEPRAGERESGTPASHGLDARFVVTSLSCKRAGAQILYERCARGDMENRSGSLFGNQTSTATLRQPLYFAAFASGRDGLEIVGAGNDRAQFWTDEVPQGRRLHLRAQGPALVFFDLRLEGTVRPGPGEPAGSCGSTDVAPVAVPAAPPPPPKAGPPATGLVCLRSLPCGGVPVRDRERPSFVRGRAPDSPAVPGFQTADRPENRVGDPELASGFELVRYPG